MGVFLRRAFFVIVFSLVIAAGAIDFRDIIGVIFGGAAGPGGSGSPPPAPTAMSVPAPSLRIATFNAYQLSWPFLCHNVLILDCLVQTSGQTEQWANRLADTILANAANIDVLALNEVWDEDAKAILIKRLSPIFPIVVKKIDSSLVPLRIEQLGNLTHGQIAGEDSGLMLFAKADFKVVPLPRADFKWGNVLEGKFLFATTSEVAFTLFDSCGGDDCYAAKGAALIRLQNRMGGPIYDVVFTHTQADYDGEPHADARAGQFNQIRRLIETTLAPLGDHVASNEAVIMLGDLNVPFLKVSPPSEFNSLFMRPGSFFTDPLRESWSTSSSLDDRYMSNSIDRERYDYILVSAPGRGMSDFKPRCVQHLTVPVDFQNLESDHFLLHADINADFKFCDPMLAMKIDLSKVKTLSVSTDSAGAPLARLNTPGAMQWFKVSSGGSGTYDISLANAGPAMFVRMDVFAPDDLTTPVSRYNKTAVVDHPGHGDFLSTRTSELYSMPGDFFIRVSGVARGLFGNYVLNVRQRDCSSKQSACVLQPGAPAQLASLSPSTLPPGQTQAQNEAWYRFDVSGKPDSGGKQSITLTANLSDAGRVASRLDSFSDPTGPSLVKSDAGAVSTFAGGAGDMASGYLVISQSSAGNAATPVSAAMDTDLRLFEFSNLTCTDETNPEIGSDDIYTLFDIDGQTARAPSSGDVEFDCDGSPDPEFWPNHFGRNTIAFSNHLLIRVAEADDTSADDLSPWFAPITLAPNAVEAHNLNLVWKFDGGSYQLDYGLRRRANAPVADP